LSSATNLCPLSAPPAYLTFFYPCAEVPRFSQKKFGQFCSLSSSCPHFPLGPIASGKGSSRLTDFFVPEETPVFPITLGTKMKLRPPVFLEFSLSAEPFLPSQAFFGECGGSSFPYAIAVWKLLCLILVPAPSFGSSHQGDTRPEHST